jgi:hypothetical protein
MYSNLLYFSLKALGKEQNGHEYVLRIIQGRMRIYPSRRIISEGRISPRPFSSPYVSMSVFLLQVSWVRHRDIHILTVATYTYTSDQRFQAIHQRSTDEWTLQIKYTQKRDAVMSSPQNSHCSSSEFNSHSLICFRGFTNAKLALNRIAAST